jgi:hypothetical protein
LNKNQTEIDNEERIIINNLLLFDLPSNLTEDKLFYRKIFRLNKLTHDEWVKKIKAKPILSAFEIYSHIATENTGPKVLYITAKS